MLNLRKDMIVVFLFVSVVGLTSLFILNSVLSWAGNPILKITGIDAVAYYSVTHSLYFDGDIDLTNQYQRLRTSDPDWFQVVDKTGLPGSPWPIGSSLLQLPFMALAHHICQWSQSGHCDGYNRHYYGYYYGSNMLVAAVAISAMYALLVSFLGSLPVTLTRNVRFLAFAVVLMVTVGSAAGYHFFTAGSHTASLAMTSLFLFYWYRNRTKYSMRHYFVLGILAGAMFLARWQDVLLICVPLVYDLVEKFGARRTDGLLTMIRLYCATAAGAFALAIPQLMAWNAIYGSWVTIPQGQDFLSFPPMNVANVLFSTRQGWFIWTPIAILGVAGIFACFALAVERGVLYGLLLAIASQLLLVGSLEYSWHGFSFGNRMLIGLTPILAIGTGVLLIQTPWTWVRWSLRSIAALMVLFTLLFAVQFRLGLIPKTRPLASAEILNQKLHLFRHLKLRRIFHADPADLEAGDLEHFVTQIEQAQIVDENRFAAAFLCEAGSRLQSPDTRSWCSIAARFPVASRPN